MVLNATCNTFNSTYSMLDLTKKLYLWKFAHGLSMFSKIPEMASARCIREKQSIKWLCH